MIAVVLPVMRERQRGDGGGLKAAATRRKGERIGG